MGGTMGAGVGAVSSVGRDPCFPAGTPVLMADGTTRPIEDVAVGDHVACTDPDTWIVLGVVEGLNPWKDEDHARTQEVPR